MRNNHCACLLVFGIIAKTNAYGQIYDRFVKPKANSITGFSIQNEADISILDVENINFPTSFEETDRILKTSLLNFGYSLKFRASYQPHLIAKTNTISITPSPTSFYHNTLKQWDSVIIKRKSNNSFSISVSIRESASICHFSISQNPNAANELAISIEKLTTYSSECSKTTSTRMHQHLFDVKYNPGSKLSQIDIAIASILELSTYSLDPCEFHTYHK